MTKIAGLVLARVRRSFEASLQVEVRFTKYFTFSKLYLNKR